MDVSEPVLVTEESMNMMQEAAELAPLHNPANLEGIRAALAVFEGRPQVMYIFLMKLTVPTLPKLDNGSRAYEYQSR